MNPSRERRPLLWLLPLSLWLLPACQQQMARQPSYRPDEPSSFFPDGQANRPLVRGTVARGRLRSDVHLFGRGSAAEGSPQVLAASIIGVGGTNPLLMLAGLGTSAAAGEESTIATFPFPVTKDVLEHGRHRYMIYCVVCHDPLGTGGGKIVERGYTAPPSFHIDRLRRAPVGHFFEVATRGYGSMPSYAAQVPPRDRWAIIAYIRALQLSQHFPERELTEDMRRQRQEQTSRKEGGQGQ